MWEDVEDDFKVSAIVMLLLKFKEHSIDMTPEYALFLIAYCRAYYFEHTGISVNAIETIRNTYKRMHDSTISLKASRDLLITMDDPNARIDLSNMADKHLQF